MNDLDGAKTIFSVPNGHYEYTRMPFGLKNARATFQRLMNTVLSGLQGLHCFIYLDDIIMYSNNLKSHIHTYIDKLTLVFDVLRKHNLKLQPDK